MINLHNFLFLITSGTLLLNNIYMLFIDVTVLIMSWGPFFLRRLLSWLDLIVVDFAWSWIVCFSEAHHGVAVIATSP